MEGGQGVPEETQAMESLPPAGYSVKILRRSVLQETACAPLVKVRVVIDHNDLLRVMRYCNHFLLISCPPPPPPPTHTHTHTTPLSLSPSLPYFSLSLSLSHVMTVCDSHGGLSADSLKIASRGVM